MRVWEDRLGRWLLAALFVAGTVQKITDPSAAIGLLEGKGLPGLLVWPATAANALGAGCLIANRFVRPAALALALYTAFTSWFHFIPDDPWQMSIFVKNWAITGGLLILASTRRSWL